MGIQNLRPIFSPFLWVEVEFKEHLSVFFLHKMSTDNNQSHFDSQYSGGGFARQYRSYSVSAIMNKDFIHLDFRAVDMTRSSL